MPENYHFSWFREFAPRIKNTPFSSTPLQALCIISWPSVNLTWGYSSETFNSVQNRWSFGPCDLEIWRVTLKNNRAPLLCHLKLYASFRIHRGFQTGVTVRKCPNWGKIYFDFCELDLLTLTICMDIIFVNDNENFMVIRWQEHSKLDESTASRYLKSPWSLSGKSQHLTLVTQRSQSWSWLTNSHPFCSMSIGPEMQLFQNLTMKIMSKAMRVVKSQGHIVGSATTGFISFSFHTNRPSDSWDTAI